MTSLRALPAALLLAALGSGAAWAAAEHPEYLPTRDVAVTYRTGGDNPAVPAEIRVFWSAATERMRIEGGPQGYVLVDRRVPKTTIVNTQMHVAFDTPGANALTRTFVFNDSMHFTRGGADTVAGHSCTVWSVLSERASGTVCVTDDGVLLRGQGDDSKGHAGRLEATEVVYAPQPASLFVPPADFTRMDPNALKDMMRTLRPQGH